MFYKIIFLFLLFSFSFAENVTTPQLSRNSCVNNGVKGYWKSTDSTSCDITIEEGYKIKIVIEEFYLNSNDDDPTRVQLTPGKLSDGKTMILTWNVTKETFLFPTNNLQMKLISQRPLNSDEHFSIYWEKFGNKTIPTEAPPTTENLPTPNPNSSEPYYYTAYLFGKTPEEFIKDAKNFRILLVDKGNEYCTKKKIPLTKNITLSSIDITLAIRCLYLWPNAEKCVEIHFAIPVYVKKPSKYELNYQHLQELWSTITDQELKEAIGWTKYSTPDNNSTLITWIMICFGIILVALVSFLVLNFLGIFKFSQRKVVNNEGPTVENQFSIHNITYSAPQMFDNQGYVFDELSEDERFDIRQRSNGQIN